MNDSNVFDVKLYSNSSNIICVVSIVITIWNSDANIIISSMVRNSVDELTIFVS